MIIFTQSKIVYMFLYRKKKVFSYDCWAVFHLNLYFFLYSNSLSFYFQRDFYIIHIHIVFFLFSLFCYLNILHTLVKKDMTWYLVLIYSLSDSSEESFRSSVIYLITFFQCTYILFKKLEDNSFHLFIEQNQLILPLSRYN